MMFDCQPRITDEREREKSENVPRSASIGPGVFSSPRGGRGLRHDEKNWLPSQTCAASVLPLCFCGRHRRSFIFQRLTTQQRLEKWLEKEGRTAAKAAFVCEIWFCLLLLLFFIIVIIFPNPGHLVPSGSLFLMMLCD